MSSATKHTPPSTLRPSGFSLIELLVGMAISMIIFLVISYVFANFENQKRVTTTSSDTQSSGMMAIVEMEQAIRSAGAGIVADDTFNCDPAKTYSYYKKGAVETSPVPGFSQNFAPVVIVNGAANAPDTIQVRVGAPVGGAVATSLVGPLLNTDPEMKVTRGSGFPVGKVIMIVDGDNSTCEVVEITGIPDSAAPNRMQVTPAAGDTWNPTAAYKTSHGWPSFSNTQTTSVYSPGAMAYRTYSVNSARQLQALNQVATAVSSTDILVGDVVTMQAQYGVSAAVGAQDVANWVEPTGEWDAAALDAAHVKRIKAIRIVIVTRAPKMESSNVSGTCANNAAGGPNKGPCAWEDTAADPAPLINLAASVTDTTWQKYRYRTFQTIVPLRNMISAGV